MRKRRTREHVIADLSANHVERHVLPCSWAVERIEKDYGIDLLLFTFAADGQVQNGVIYLPLKATAHLRFRKRDASISFQLSSSDLDSWLAENVPVILIVYDAKRDLAYWLYLQAYFASQKRFRLSPGGQGVTVSIPTSTVVDTDAIRQFSLFRDQIASQMKGRIRHGS